MASKFFSERNLRFLLYEVFDVASLTRYDYYKEYDAKLLDMVLKAAMELAGGLAWPIFQEMDRNPPELIDDGIKVHPSVRKFLEECGAGGWIGGNMPFEWGGQQLPQIRAFQCLSVNRYLIYLLHGPSKSLIPAHYTNHHTLHRDSFNIQDDRIHRRIGRLQPDQVALSIQTFQGCLLVVH